MLSNEGLESGLPFLYYPILVTVGQKFPNSLWKPTFHAKKGRSDSRLSSPAFDGSPGALARRAFFSNTMNTQHSLADFHPVVRRWFEQTYGEPSPPQVLGWPSISSGKNTLILAPTGSGKTLAAFLWAINHLVEQHLRERLDPGVRILYVSPLKALNNDIERNLAVPLQGIKAGAATAGLKLPLIRTAVRTGDTPQHRRASMVKHPPDILITTPESLYLMLTSRQARKIFTTVQYVIIDEIHSICGNKRGVHLSLTLERLQALAHQDFIRIGLSATQRPLEEIAAFLGGCEWTVPAGSSEAPRPEPRSVAIIDAGRKKDMDLRVECPIADFSLLPQQSVWPLIFQDLLDHIKSHRTTLIFVNNRRLAERVAAKLNELIWTSEGEKEPVPEREVEGFHLYAVPQKTFAPASRTSIPEILAYHGSMSRQKREEMERDLKEGKLRALVATSSLELGIDIGSIDLVIQLQSPKGIARGLQRVGRSGHLITATSKGRIFPTHREDLVESTVVARAMREHEVEQTTIPRDCLDVLAQQIAAMVSVDEWEIPALFRLVRQSYCYRNLPEKLFNGVVQMLAGRYTDEAFRELRARVSWDRVNNTLRPLPGTSQLAITSGGTIADRGYFPVYLEDGKTKVGEVDEEFVYESRTGDTFILGTNVWRMTTIDDNTITVSPAPGQPARMPFWRGEGIGRSFELGRKVGAFRREMSEREDSPDCLTWLQKEFPIDSRSAWNIQEYFRKQQQSTGVIPHDRLIVIEGFRDEIGDPRIIVHSTFGRRVNGLLGLVLEHRLHEATGVEPQMLYNDDGVLLRCPDADALPLDLLDGLTLNAAEDLVLDQLLASPLFGGQFRQNAARALLMPKIAPGKRTPLWLQRLRAGDLLQIARRYDDFPIVIETLREVLNDVLDFDHFKEIVQEIEAGTLQVRSVQTEVPSPFSASLLFDFIAVYMYEWDQPKADRLSQYLAVNRELLSEIVDLETLPSMMRPEAVSAVEAQLQHTAEGYRARSPEELLEILIRVGDLTEEEIDRRCVGNGKQMLNELAQNGRAVRVRLPAGDRWIAGEERAVYSDITAEPHLIALLRRFIQNHGPVSSTEFAGRYGIETATVNALEAKIAEQSGIVRGRFRPVSPSSQDETQWCFRPNVEKIHRQTIAFLRKEIKPSTLPEFTNFLFHWQHIAPSTKDAGIRGVEGTLIQMQGYSLAADLWERSILASRIRDYSSPLLAQLTSTGDVVWMGTGTGKMGPIFRGEGSLFIASEPGEEGLQEPARRVLAFLRQHGASFLADVRNGTHLSLDAINAGIAELFWAGFITNDVFGEVLGIRKSTRTSPELPIERAEMVDPRHNPRRGRIMQSVRRAMKQVPGWTGRWSLIHLPGVMGAPAVLDEQASRQASQMLDRYGIVAREFYRRETLLPWAMIATELQRMEMRGEIRRGYFIEGLSGMQYAHPNAVEEMRRVRGDERSGVLLLNTCDPANPYGTGINLPADAGQQVEPRLLRHPENYIAFLDGVPVVFLEHASARIWTFPDVPESAIAEALGQFIGLIRLPEHMRPFKEVLVEQCNGMRPAETPLAGILKSLGFVRDRNQTMRLDEYSI